MRLEREEERTMTAGRKSGQFGDKAVDDGRGRTVHATHEKEEEPEEDGVLDDICAAVQSVRLLTSSPPT